MSQAGIVDIIGTHPEIPTLFVCNVGSAVPIANTLEILGSTVAAHSVPLETVGSGNTVDIQVQYASSAVSSVANNAGVASFDSADFVVDANGYVTLSAGAGIQSVNVDGNTAPGTDPVLPDGLGQITVTGGQVAAGTTANVIRTFSLAANTYTIQIQRSQAVGSSTVGDNGVSHFNSTYFTVDANGFVSVSGTGLGQTITGQSGGALSPTAGNWNIFGAAVAAGTSPVATSGSGSTLTVNVQRSQAIAATDATNVGLAAFNSAYFTVDGNGFVSVSGTGLAQTITGNTGGALSPTAGNWNIVGTGSLTTAGSGSTLTAQLTGLTNHNVLVGAGTATITNVAPSATSGVPLISQGGAADPAFGTAVVAGGGTGATTLTNHGVLLGQGTSAVVATSVGATGTVLAGNTGADPTFQSISSLGGITSITGNSGGAEVPLAGNFNIVGTGSITVAGSANTETVQLTGLTNHNVQVGAGTATLTQVAPSATAGIPLVSNGSSADPSFTTAVVAGGGTGNTTFTAYSVICAGTTATGAFQNVSGVGTSGQVLTSNGAAALPSWQNAASSGITTINGDTGSVTGSTITFKGNGGVSLKFSGSGTTMTLNATDANFNTVYGLYAGTTSATGQYNHSFGVNSLRALTTGIENCGLGYQFCTAVTSGGHNIGVGHGSYQNLITGSWNCGIGDQTGVNYSGSESSNIDINSLGTTSQSNVLTIGSGTGTGNQQVNKAVICGINGKTSASGVAVLVNSFDVLGTTTSSIRFKENVQDMGDSSVIIQKLRPVTFQYKTASSCSGVEVSEEEAKITQYGLIAEEVAKIFPDMVQFDKKDQPQTVRYLWLIPMLLNEVQKMRKEIDELRSGK